MATWTWPPDAGWVNAAPAVRRHCITVDCAPSGACRRASTTRASRHDDDLRLTGSDLGARRNVGVRSSVLAQHRGEVTEFLPFALHLAAALLELRRPLELARPHPAPGGSPLVAARHGDLGALHHAGLPADFHLARATAAV